MPLTGAAVGASNTLEQIVADRLLAQKLQAEIAARQEAASRDQQRIDAAERQNSWERSRAEKLDAERATERGRVADQESTQRRGRSNMAGVLSMGLDPETARREIAVSSLNADVDVPKGVMDMMAPPPAPKKYQVTTPDARGNPISRLVPEEEMAQGVPVYREPRAPREASTPDQVWVLRNGQPTPIAKGSARPGDTPYDPVAARTSQPANTAEAVDTAREAGRIASELRKHKGMGRAFGVFDSIMPTFNQDTADAESLRDALTSLLTLENMGKMKGVLSDADMKVLRQASTTLNPRMGDRAAAAELDRIVEVMNRVGGGAPTIDTPPPSGGGGVADLVYDPVTKTLKPRGGQ